MTLIPFIFSFDDFKHQNYLTYRKVFFLSLTIKTSQNISQHLYPYGMLMQERSKSSTDCRFGFQGQEQDNEIKGKGNSVNYKYRMHSPRMGRFFAVDPLAPKYPHNSPYAFSENRVVDGVELEGLEFYKKGQSLISAQTDCCNFSPSFLIHVNKLEYNVTKNAFRSLYNTAYFPEKPVSSIPSMSESVVSVIVHNIKSINDNPAEFREKYSGSPQMVRMVDKAISMYGGLTNVQGTVSGIGGLLILATETLKTIQRGQLAEGLINLRINANNFEKAISLTNFAVKNGFIPTEFLKTAGPGSQPADGNMGLKTDLINYLLDGTVPNSDDPTYNKMIQETGEYIWNNRDIGVTMFRKGVDIEILPGESQENYLTPATHYDNLSPSKIVLPLPVYNIIIDLIDD